MMFNRKIPASHIVLVSFLLFLGAVLFVGCNSSDSYVMIPDRATGLFAGSEVQIEDVVVGEVAEISSSNRFPGREIIRINLDQEYSIPSNSKVRIKKSKDQGKKIIQIVVVASKSYLNPGDTMFFSMPEEVTETPVDSLRDIPQGLEYRIQIFASGVSHSLDSPVFKGLENIEEKFDGTLYRYYIGQLSSVAEAKTVRQNIVEKGIEDAFIVAFVNGERISLDQANQYEN